MKPPSHIDRLDEAIDRGEDPFAVLADILQQPTKPTSNTLDLKGTEINGYRFVRLLGVGGMGATYEAQHGEDRVAVKVVGILDESSRKRFESEVTILRSLKHPSIVGYRNSGLLRDGNAFLVMDLLEGQSLQDVLDELQRETPGSIAARLLDSGDGIRAESYRRRVLRLIATVASALHYAHQKGVIHRDIKPGNIMVSPELEPTLIDFGLSRDLFRNVSLTNSSAIMGTMSYMAPEQFESAKKKVDVRTDVFSLGLVLYRCLVGDDLRHEITDVLSYHKQPLLIPEKVSPTLPLQLQAILYRCLDHRPERRYQSAEDFESDLRAALGTGTVRAKMPSAWNLFFRSKVGRRTFMGTCSAGILGSMYLLWKRPWEEDEYRVSIDAINDATGNDARLDGEKLLTPSDWTLKVGAHRIEYASTTGYPMQQQFDVIPDRHHYQVNLLTVPRARRYPDEHTFGDYAGEDCIWLNIRSGLAGGELFLGQERIQPGLQVLPPGTYDVRAISESGEEEGQRIVTKKGHRYEVGVFPDGLSKVRGGFRRSLMTPLSPVPQGVRWDPFDINLVDDGLIVWMEEVLPDGHLYCYVTPAISDQFLTARITVDFDEPVRSLVAKWWMHEKDLPIEAEYQLGTSDWRPATSGTSGQLALPELSEEIRSFSLRGTIKTSQTTRSWKPTQFLRGAIGVNPTDHAFSTAAFAIVADPKPGTCRLG